MCAYALLAGTEQMESEQPLAKRDVAISEDRTHGDGKLLPASATLPHALANVFVLLGWLRLKPISVIEFATMRANRAIWPSQLL